MKSFNPTRNKSQLPYRKVAECYLIYKNKLVAQDAIHYLSIPGGGVDEGESPEKAGKRELLEEIGAVLKGKLQLVSVMNWDWSPQWARNPKRQKRYMQFRGEEVYSFIGVVDKFEKPNNADDDAWKGKKLMSFNTANKIMERVMKKAPENEYAYNLTKLNIISTINQLNKKKLLK